MNKRNLYNTLVQSLRLVASPPDVQVAALPKFVNIPDEIALTFNDANLIAPQLEDEELISSHSLDMLKELDELFETMSEDKNLWTIEKLENDKFWRGSRELAINILKEMNEPYSSPNLDFIKWTE